RRRPGREGRRVGPYGDARDAARQRWQWRNLAFVADVSCRCWTGATMSEAAKYSAFESMRDGRRMEIRALRPDDRDELLSAVDRASAQSLHRRFFAVRRRFTEREIDYFVNVDFVDHVGLVAIVEEADRPRIVGGARFVVVEPGQAEVAFAVIDQYQGQ